MAVTAKHISVGDDKPPQSAISKKLRLLSGMHCHRLGASSLATSEALHDVQRRCRAILCPIYPLTKKTTLASERHKFSRNTPDKNVESQLVSDRDSDGASNGMISLCGYTVADKRSCCCNLESTRIFFSESRSCRNDIKRFPPFICR